VAVAVAVAEAVPMAVAVAVAMTVPMAVAVAAVAHQLLCKDDVDDVAAWQ
jgi:hypothetical protein